jgi:glucose/sorbosone dehydrogenase
MRIVVLAAAFFAFAFPGRSAAPTEYALQLADFAAMPITGDVNGETNNSGALARLNFLREEPAPARRFFVNDLNGQLYIVDRNTKAITTYLDLNGRGHGGVFRRLTYENGLASGFTCFEFDPDYANNGRFYTIHQEDVEPQIPATPDNAKFPGLRVDGYTTTPPVRTPGEDKHEAVLVEWTDTNPKNSTFEGTARELLRIPAGSRFHPMDDLAFNPTARPGDPDWRVMYVAIGDSAAGEQTTAIRLNPQRLDTLGGKILRIVPDLSAHTDSTTVSENGRYRIPKDNPFVSIAGARGEIWAYGLRNPHRLTWDVDPANPSNNHLIANVVGLRTWETVVIIHKGANYGYSRREGNQALLPDNSLAPLPQDDRIPVQVSDTVTHGTVVPRYPVLEYGHDASGGDAIAGGAVYRGKSVPALQGKYVLGDTSTGRLWWADFNEMLAVDGSHPPKLAQLHEFRVSRDGGAVSTLFDIVKDAYHARGGKRPELPGKATLAPNGRVDERFALDSAGELYLLTKSDAMIRKVTGFVSVRRTQTESR